jgi:hypothetical protein
MVVNVLVLWVVWLRFVRINVYFLLTLLLRLYGGRR